MSEAKDKIGAMPNLNLVLSNAEDYLMQCNVRFNIVLMLEVLEHVKSPSAICHTVHKQLIAGGIALIIVSSGYDVPELYLALDRLIKRIRGINEPEGGPHCQRFTLQKIHKIFYEAGFEYRFVSSIYTTWFPFTLLIALGRRGFPAYLNLKLADVLPNSITSSWLVKGTKRIDSK